MGNLTRAKINDYYDQFRPVAVTFTKEVISVTGLLTKMVNLKCGSDFFPCVIYSTSFEAAKVVANNRSGIIEKLQATKNSLSLRFCFKIPATGEQIAFLVPGRLTEQSPYAGSEDMTLFTLQFSQRPPDDLIEIMGRVLEANYHFSKNKDLFFPMSDDVQRRMCLVTKDIVNLAMDGNAYTGILRQLAFGAACCIMKGLREDILNKPISIRFEFDDPHEFCALEGVVKKCEAVANYPDTAVITMGFNDPVSMVYKVRLCDYVTTLRLPTDGPPAAPKPAKPAPAADDAQKEDGEEQDGQ
ncbi:MAG: pilus assembly protein PilZ [Spirochaetaceae bacterium]|jgi:hypothetical protein|nr:pilus assembly protein PilZ [Spirochaetaceae bacterium]